jgi:hypothetical protein
MKDESTVQQEAQLYARSKDCFLMRNNCGAFKDETGRMVRYGLGNISKQHQENSASSDLIGFTRILITPDMVGKTLAVFTAAECKKEAWNPDKKFDKRERAQLNFINWVVMNGGYAGFINSVDSFGNILPK